ncbi:helix-turn-helix domain-containing protein [Patescibacteria group bacterium]|nr:helix-turn-helix domain-containing protein [Patescibacteria group bacterium]
MQRTYKYRLYPNKEQIRKFEQILNTCRHLYNNALTQRKEYYQENKKGLFRIKQQKLLKERRKIFVSKLFIPKSCKMFFLE